MPVKIIISLTSKLLLSRHYLLYALAIFVVAVLRAYCQGRVTNRERDLHARVVLLTGGFTPLGLTILENLALRGAHVIALSPHPVDTPQVELVVEAMRANTTNDQIFAEYCDLSSPSSVHAFCTKFLTGQEPRLDVLLFTHECQHIGPMLGKGTEVDEQRRTTASLSTFLITTLLLPVLLMAPPERDIRIVNVINPFYAAAVPTFASLSRPANSALQREGYRSLRTSILTRHLQRILDALPSAPAPDPNSAEAPLASLKDQKSNIVAVSVTPGISRTDTVGPMLRAHGNLADTSVIGFLSYLLLQPILRIVTKSPYYAVQSVLHALFLPTPFKRVPPLPGVTDANKKSIVEDLTSIEILKPGALYSDCSVVPLKIPVSTNSTGSPKEKEEMVILEDDGEMGGEELGRAVWENYEVQLKLWEEKDKSSNATASGGQGSNDTNVQSSSSKPTGLGSADQK